MIALQLRYVGSKYACSRFALLTAAPAVWLLLSATTWAQPSGFPKGDPWADRPAATGGRPWNRSANPSYGPGAKQQPQASNDEAPPPKFREDEARNQTARKEETRPQARRSGYKTRVSDDQQGEAAPPDIMAGAKPVEEAELLAEVGSENIFLSDIMWQTKPYFDQIKAAVDNGDATEEQAAAQKRIIIRNFLMEALERKLLYSEFRRKINKLPEDKRPKMDELKAKTSKAFDEKLAEERKRAEGKSLEEWDEYLATSQVQAISRLAGIMKQKGMWTNTELERFLQLNCSSIRKQKDAFAEQQLGMQTIFGNMDMKPEVSHDEMLIYYEEHAEKYDYPARAKFEVLMVKKSKFETRDEAYAAICKMGDEVFYGASFAAVAKRESQDFNADKGGKFDWTPQKVLSAKALDEKIFSVPLHKLSDVVEDDRGFYIVRVTEREDAGRKTFAQVQEEIRKEIVREKQRKQYSELMARIKEETRIWTVFDDEMKAQRDKEEVARKRLSTSGLR